MKASRPAPRWGHGLAAGTAHARAVSGAPLGGGAVAPIRQAVPSGRRPPVGRQPHGGDAVEAPPGGWWVGRTPPAPADRARLPPERGPVGAALAPAPAGAKRGRLRQRTLDAA